MGAGGSTSLFLSREILSITGITIRETGVAGKGHGSRSGSRRDRTGSLASGNERGDTRVFHTVTCM